jgi:hypothetical protein
MQKLSDQWVTDFQRFGKTNMDFAALQQKLFDLDPSDRAEDLRRLSESVGGMPQESVQTEENFLQESVEIAEGTMPVEGDYSLSDFAALAGVRLPDVPLNESQKTVNELDAGGAFKRGWDNHNNLGAVGVENPLKGLGKSKPTDKDNVGAKKPSQATLSTFLKKHTAQLHKIAADPRKSKKFDDFMARMAEDVQEAPKLKMPKTRNPVASHAQSSGSGVHADQNKKKQPMRKDKHKKQLNFEAESIKEMLYRKLNAKK